MTREIDADLCVIGAGSGGLSVASGAAQLGKSVVLCEKGEMGGDCLNYGCVPSKALIAAAAAATGAAAKFGLTAPAVRMDYAAVMDHVRSVIAAIAPHDSQERFEKLGCTVIRAAAEFVGPRRVRAGEAVVTAKHFVIATGSSPSIPPIEGLKEVPYFTNETIFANTTCPEHLIVIGGGPIGVELAQAHVRLQCRVTVIEAARILGQEEPDAVEILRDALKRDGIDLREGASAKSVRRAGGGILVDLGAETIAGSHLLIAVGRRPNTDGLGLEKAGVAVDKKGIVVDERLRTSNRRIYAIGDVAGGLQFTHVAGDHASTVIRNILFKTPAKRRDALAPRVTYCDPEIASIGLDEQAAKKRHRGARVVKWPFKDNDRAQTEKDTAGFARIVTDGQGRILGAVIVGKGAGDQIFQIALAMANGLKIGAFAKAIAPYPTRSEVSKRAAGLWYSRTLFSDRTRALVRLLSTFD